MLCFSHTERMGMGLSGGCGPNICRTVVYFSLTFFFLILISNEASSRSTPELLQRQFAVGTNRNAREVTQCPINCTSTRRRPVCGTDGQTYANSCAVKRLRKCEKRKIKVAAKGSCSGLAASARSALRPSSSSSSSSSSSTIASLASRPHSSNRGEGGRGSSSRASRGNRCLQERQQALQLASSPPADVYIPRCRSDGTFAKVQCHQATGYCWCASSEGKPVPGSSVRGQKITCTESKGRGRKSRRPKKRARRQKRCNPTERSTFNTNLISLFTEEYERVPKPTQPSYPGAPKDLPIKSKSDSLLDTLEKRVIEWKFSELDADKDNKLKRREIRALKRMVKKQVRPKACARNFDQYCDLDQDKKIARAEWSVCLGVDINRLDDNAEEEEEEEEEGQEGRTRGEGVRPTLFDKQILNGGSRTSEEDPETQSEMPSQRNCLQERQSAQEMDEVDPEGRIFIPECTEAGKFRQEQCHSSTGYCWCVDETTGKPIPGTSTHNVMPDCTTKQGRIFKGCSYPLKKRFLTELLDEMSTEIGEYANNATGTRLLPEPDPDHSFEERVVRWKLRMLDKNRNGALERRELKDFKQEIRKRKVLRKCSRNFINYCDSNDDKSIVMEEWIDCMGVNDQQRNLPVNPKRRGPNPFSKYLKS